MIILETSGLANFILEHKLINAHCTVYVDKELLCADYVIVDDTCIYQYHEDKLDYVYYDQDENTVFSFEVPRVILFTGKGVNLRLCAQNNMGIMELTCNKPYFTSIIKVDDNHSDKIDNISGEFISFKPYAPLLKAIKQLKGLATELSTSVSVEMGDSFWTVSVAQCCIFGAAKGIKGSIQSQLFEKIYEYDSYVAQPTNTSLLIKKTVNNGWYLINVPISRNAEFPSIIPKMVGKCKNICESQITPDVGMITGEIIRNVKKETISLTFTDNRMDLQYVTNQISLTTVPRDLKLPKGISITVPVKTLACVVDILDKPTQIMTNGEFICLMRDNRGLLISGIVS